MAITVIPHSMLHGELVIPPWASRHNIISPLLFLIVHSEVLNHFIDHHLKPPFGQKKVKTYAPIDRSRRAE